MAKEHEEVAGMDESHLGAVAGGSAGRMLAFRRLGKKELEGMECRPPSGMVGSGLVTRPI